MKNDKLYSISEFAEKVGLSRQAVYKRMKTDLSTYIIEVDSKQMLKESAFALFDCKPSVNPVDNLDNSFYKSYLSNLSKTLDTLQEQLAVKDKTIEVLQKQLEEERQHSRELSERVASLADQAQKLQLAQFASSESAALIEDKNIKRHWWQKKRN